MTKFIIACSLIASLTVLAGCEAHNDTKLTCLKAKYTYTLRTMLNQAKPQAALISSI